MNVLLRVRVRLLLVERHLRLVRRMRRLHHLLRRQAILMGNAEAAVAAAGAISAIPNPAAGAWFLRVVLVPQLF